MYKDKILMFCSMTLPMTSKGPRDAFVKYDQGFLENRTVKLAVFHKFLTGKTDLCDSRTLSLSLTL